MKKWWWKWTYLLERNHQEVLGRELGWGLQFHPFFGKQWVIFHHPSWGMLTKLILLNIHPRILIFDPYNIFTKLNGPYLYLSISLEMGLSTFNGPFVIWISFIILCQTSLILPILCRMPFLKCTKWPPHPVILPYSISTFKLNSNAHALSLGWRMTTVTLMTTTLNKMNFALGTI